MEDKWDEFLEYLSLEVESFLAEESSLTGQELLEYRSWDMFEEDSIQRLIESHSEYNGYILIEDQFGDWAVKAVSHKGVILEILQKETTITYVNGIRNEEVRFYTH